MTLPDERYHSINNAREFLRDLLDPKKTPRVPRSIRTRAYWALRHFPAEYHVEELARKSPKVIKKDRE